MPLPYLSSLPFFLCERRITFFFVKNGHDCIYLINKLSLYIDALMVPINTREIHRKQRIHGKSWQTRYEKPYAILDTEQMIYVGNSLKTKKTRETITNRTWKTICHSGHTPDAIRYKNTTDVGSRTSFPPRRGMHSPLSRFHSPLVQIWRLLG
jgi:hypothetical protein